MNIRIGLPFRFPSNPPRAYKILLTLLLTVLMPGSLLTEQIDDRAWYWKTLSWILLVTVIATIIIVGDLARHLPTHTAEQLRRPHLRAWSALGHPFVGYTVIAVFLAASTVAALTLNIDRDKDDKPDLAIDLRYTAIVLAVYLTCAALILSHNYRKRHADHFPSGPARENIRTLVRRIGHRAYWVPVAFAPLFIAVVVFTPDKGIWAALRLILLATNVLATLAMYRHSDALCEACFREFRPDAPEYAATRTWRFKFFHYAMGPIFILYFGSIVTSQITDSRTGDLIFGIAMSVAAAAVPFNVFHDHYQPWCPLCRRGDGDDDPTEVPDPEPSEGKPVPA